MLNFKNNFFANHRVNSDFHWHDEHNEFWSSIAERYDRYLSKKGDFQIPKIHQIWIGKNLPNQYQKWCLEWKKYNPDYEYKLWNESEILRLGLVNEKIFLETNNVGIKSDIARYEILYRFGGIYLDTDMQLIKPFDNFLHTSNFISCINSSYIPCILNGFIACASNCQITSKLIYTISNNSHKPQERGVATLDFSGPNLLTKTIKNLKLEDDFLILPSQYFYPWPNFLRSSTIDKKVFVTSKSYAIHHWEVSWCRPSFTQIIINKVKSILKLLRRSLNF